MTQIEKEKVLDSFPLYATISETELILKQMKHSICKIKFEYGYGTGFFCKLLNKKLLITNNHIINEKIINEQILKDNNSIKVSLNDDTNRFNIKIKNYYTSIEYDTTIFEINDFDKNIIYLELDDEIFDQNFNIYNESLYIIQYPQYGNEQKAAVSHGLLKKIDGFEIMHKCSTSKGSSGSPLIKLSNKKVIGIHKESISKYDYKYKKGTLLKYPINEYLNKLKQKNEFNQISNKNEIKLIANITKEDVNKDFHFLGNINQNYFEDDRNYIEQNYLKELNELNTEIYINNIKYKYTKSFKPEKEGLYEIKIKFNFKVKDCSFMFFGCSKLKDIDLSSFDTDSVINMSYMFFGCSNLTNINLSFFNTKNVIDMRNMFCNCSKLTNIDLSSLDINKVTNLSYMFSEDCNLININLSSFVTKNVINMSHMFNGCSKLANIDLSFF